MNSIKDLLVGNLMTRQTTTVVDTDDLSTAIGTMEALSLINLPVVTDQGNVCGVLSTSDLTSLMYERECEVALLPVVSAVVRKTLIDAMAEEGQNKRVLNFMSRSPVTVAWETTIQNAARLMVQNQIHHLPVVDKLDRVVGILSTTDIVRAVANEGDVNT